MQLRPSIIIGLGSSGVNIIKEFRRLVFEQYGKAGLPIMSYLGVETDAGYKIEDPILPDSFLSDPYEKITLYKSTVAGAKEILGIKSDDLAKWLDPEKLTAAGFSIVAGAGADRMNGRIAFWKHGASLSEILAGIFANVTSQNNKDDTIDFFGGPASCRVEIQGYNIYMVGSLLGGTCSGMFYDFAYMIQRQLQMGDVSAPDGFTPATPALHGIFTTIDSVLTGFQENHKKARNCWAALMELDYYMDPANSYDYDLPSMNPKEPVIGPPFSAVELVSRVNQLGAQFAPPGGLAKWNGEELNRMVALRLFNAILGELDTQWQAKIVDGTTGGRQELDKDLATRTLVSTGVAAIYSPKIEVAEIFSCRQARRLCDMWGAAFDPSRNVIIDGIAGQDWKTILKIALDASVVGADGTSVPNAIQDHANGLDMQLNQFPITNLAFTLVQYPPEQPFYRRLDSGGDLRSIIANKMVGLKTLLRTELDGIIASRFSKIGAGRDGNDLQGLTEARLYVEKLKTLIESDLGKCPHAAPGWNFAGIAYDDKIEQLVGSQWITMLQLGVSGLLAAKRKILSSYKEALLRYMKEVRRFYIKDVLSDLINNAIPGKLNDIQAAVEKLQGVTANLSSVEATIAKAGQVSFDNMLVVSNYSSPAEHVSALERQCDTTSVFGGLASGVLAGRGITEFINNNKDVDKIAEKMRKPFSEWALQAMRADGSGLIANALARFENSDKLTDLAKRSYPYQQFSADYKPLTWAGPMDYICGNDNLPVLKAYLTAQNAALNYALHPSSLEDLVVLARVEPHFSMNHLAAAQDMKNVYQAMLNTKPHTDIQQAAKFDKARALQRNALLKRLSAIQALSPNGIFEPRETRDGRIVHIFQPVAGDGNPVGFINMSSPNGQHELCDFLSDDKNPLSQPSLNKFNEAIRNTLLKQGAAAIQQRRNALNDEWMQKSLDGGMSQKEMNQKLQAVDQLIRQVFPPARGDEAGLEGAIPLSRSRQ